VTYFMHMTWYILVYAATRSGLNMTWCLSHFSIMGTRNPWPAINFSFEYRHKMLGEEMKIGTKFKCLNNSEFCMVRNVWFFYQPIGSISGASLADIKSYTTPAHKLGHLTLYKSANTLHNSFASHNKINI
jgi:hypothetical protein